jgi:hypothetical protein
VCESCPINNFVVERRAFNRKVMSLYFSGPAHLLLGNLKDAPCPSKKASQTAVKAAAAGLRVFVYFWHLIGK